MIALSPSGEQAVDDEAQWRRQARCADGQASLTELFFSEDPDDIEAAKAFCSACPVRAECLAGALARQEAAGVWGGHLIVDGQVVVAKRRRGRPPLPRDPETGEIVRDPARAAELRTQAEARERALVREAERLAASALARSA